MLQDQLELESSGILNYGALSEWWKNMHLIKIYSHLIYKFGFRWVMLKIGYQNKIKGFLLKETLVKLNYIQ